MCKSILSKRNPLNEQELNNYYVELEELKMLRANIKYDFGKKWNTVYTEPQAEGKCRMKLYCMKKKHMKKIVKYVKHYNNLFTFSAEKHVYDRWHGKVYSVVLRVK